MKKILMSIKPQYVEKILEGTKKYEFRTKAAKEDIDALIIYSTYPTKKVVAEVEILEVLKMTPSELWEETKEYSGISKLSFDNYFKNRNIAYAYKLGKVTEFLIPKDLNQYGINYAPQSFVYIYS
ncbi:MAG: ASCH domain-containing protein [Acholeplasmataceae bacterium]|jgi:predicted transcriptional regulator|nr:ASCH domain-containing protein [Acholeplasmataceae bacterium]